MSGKQSEKTLECTVARIQNTQIPILRGNINIKNISWQNYIIHTADTFKDQQQNIITISNLQYNPNTQSDSTIPHK